MKYPGRILIDLNQLKTKKKLEFAENYFIKKMKIFFKDKKLVKIKNCPCCGSKKIFFLIKKYRINYFMCEIGSIFMNPVPKDKDIKKIYELNDLYSSHRTKLANKKSLHLRKISNNRKAKQLSYFLKQKNKSILDYGSGNNSFLESCNKLKFKNLYSFDIGFKKDEFDGKIFKTNNLKKLNKKFDAITLWGVLEHMKFPLYELSKIKKELTKKGSIIVLDIPSSDSLLSHVLFKSDFSTNRYLEPYRHLVFFSKNFISNICKKLNLKIILLETNGLDIQTILSSSQKSINNFLVKKQLLIDELNLGDHYRVFLKSI